MANKSTGAAAPSRYFPIRVGAQLREHMRALRKQAGLTQAQLGHRLGVGQARIAEIENNPAATSVEQFLRVLSTLGAGLAISTAESEAAPAKERPPVERKAPPTRVPASPQPKKPGGASALVSPAARTNVVIRAKKGTW